MNKIKLSFLAIVLGAACLSDAIAQQDPMYSQYMFNMLSVNPAYAGSRDMLSMTALYRKQWVGIEGAPSTMTLGIDAPIRNQKMALGLNLVSDQIGISKDLNINVLYAYRIYFNNMGRLSMGLQGGVSQRSADYSSVNTGSYYGGSPDDQAFQQSMRAFLPNFGFGAYYHADRFFAGIGVPRMLKNNLRGKNAPTADFTSFPNRQNRHLFITSGYTFDLNNDWDARPSVLIKAVQGAPIEGDINVNLWWRNTMGAGLSYRTADAIVAMLEFKPKKEIHIGYAYDYTVSGFSGTNSGSHELMLRYEPHASKMKPNTSQFQRRAKGFNSRGYRKLQQRKKPHHRGNRAGRNRRR